MFYVVDTLKREKRPDTSAVYDLLCRQCWNRGKRINLVIKTYLAGWDKMRKLPGVPDVGVSAGGVLTLDALVIVRRALAGARPGRNSRERIELWLGIQENSGSRCQQGQPVLIKDARIIVLFDCSFTPSILAS
jgi:hypothetical protein